jgi:flagellar basal-body rod protein FlgB
MDAMGRIGPLMHAMLDAATLRQRVVAENIANVETPGYRARKVTFDSALEQAVSEGRLESMDGAKAEIDYRDGRVKSDGNDVNPDQEIGEMNRNALAYRTLLTVVAAKNRMMQAAVSGRGG